VLATSALQGGAAPPPRAAVGQHLQLRPTTTAGDSLGRPAEGVVHLVATTVDGTKVASGVVLDARGTIATTAAGARRHRCAAYLADGTEYEATILGLDTESGAAVVRVGASPSPCRAAGPSPCRRATRCTPAGAPPPPSMPSA
jgi:S1-C subfamily serine protease